MEKHRPSELLRNRSRADYEAGGRSRWGQTEQLSQDSGVSLRAREVVLAHMKERERKASRRKWGGLGFIFLGSATIMASCPLYAFSLIGPDTLIAGLILIGGGFGLMAWRPKLKDTNEALIVAMKHGNRLTTPRLALELDISFEKAEKIIRELVKNGIAEIDLEHQDPDAIVYRIKGL